MNTGDEITVLLVDDDPDFGELARISLQRADETLTVQTATDASTGLDRLAAKPVDCIVSDYDMPRQDGLEFLKAVREKHPALPFILFTGKGSEEIASEAISAGVTDYLQKETNTEQYTVLANRIRNVVERYRAEQKQEQQRKAIETAQEGISIINEDGEYTYVNQAYADLYGYEPEEMVGEHWRLIYPEEEVSFAKDVILPTATETGIWQGETTGLRADGTTFPEAHTVAVAETGQLICTVRDRSQTQRRESDLTQFRTLVETLNDPVYVLDETGRFEYVNDAFVEMVGYDRKRILGAAPSLIKSAAAVERGETQLGEILSSDSPDSTVFEIEIQPKDGEPIYCEDHMGVLPYEGEAFEGSVGILRDITGRKERERRLEKQNEQLEEFASIVSHDLRTPLSVAKGSVELVEEPDEDIERAERALNRMETLIESLLTLMRGKERAATIEAVGLAAVAEACWENVEAQEATLVTDVRRRIRADRDQLYQALQNLLQNAVKHGGDDVTVVVGELADGFYVEDDGTGLPDGESEKVFSEGYSTHEEGMGLGLRIVERVCEAHGWTVRGTEGSNGGARFEITGVEFPAE